MMGALPRLRSLLRGLFRRSTIESDMQEEFRHHIELRAADLEREGLSPEEARRQAHREFGHTEGHREKARASRGLRFFDELRFSWLDVKLGIRMLWKHPGLTAVAVFSLAIGIPVGIAPLHVARAIVAPLPEDSENRVRSIRLYSEEMSATTSPRVFEFERWQEELRSFESFGAARVEFVNVTPEGGSSIAVRSAEITASTFTILGVAPTMGRVFNEQDEVPGAPRVVLIGEDLWRNHFGSDAAIVGKSLRIGSEPHAIVGLLPADFAFPTDQELWLPLREPSPSTPGGLGLMVFGRLAEGVSEEQAVAEVATSGQRLADEFPGTYARLQAEVVPFGLSLIGMPRGGLTAMPEFYFFQILAVILLLVPCANVAMLIFARTATRARELAVRTALGAGRLRIVSQVLTESFVLAVVAAGLGLVVVNGGLDMAYRWAADNGTPFPYWVDLGVNLEAAIWALGLAALCAVLAGLPPALRVTGKAVHQSIQRAQASRQGSRFGGFTGVLIAGDVVIAILVIGFVLSIGDQLTVAMSDDDLVGIPAEEYLAVELTLPTGEANPSDVGFDGPLFAQRLGETQRALVGRLESEPGVRAVAVASALPRMDHPSRMFEVEGAGDDGGNRTQYMRTVRVDVGFFEALERPILAGRGFNGSDVTADRSTVIVNSTFVDRILGGRNPIGRRLRFATPGDEAPWLEIVGVVGHLGINTVNSEGDNGVYVPAAPGEIFPLRLALHLVDDPASFAPRVREIVDEVDPTMVLAPPVVLSSIYQGDWYLMLAMTVGLAFFVGILVTLAASGIFAILSFSVSERTRELGIRTALGARPSSIVMTVARRALIQMGIGILIGVPLAARLMVDFRSEARAISGGNATLTALAIGLAVVGLIALFACTVPTLRALRIQPTEALRAE